MDLLIDTVGSCYPVLIVQQIPLRLLIGLLPVLCMLSAAESGNVSSFTFLAKMADGTQWKRRAKRRPKMNQNYRQGMDVYDLI